LDEVVMVDWLEHNDDSLLLQVSFLFVSFVAFAAASQLAETTF
jgi:hypothetical protein